MHYVKYIREADTGKTRGVCSCNASYSNKDFHKVVEWANNFKRHERLPAHEPPLLKEGFVSGLPDPF